MFSHLLVHQKKALVNRCEAERLALKDAVEEFRDRTHWVEVAADKTMEWWPRLKWGTPVLGLLAARYLPQGLKWLGILKMAWLWGQKFRPMLALLTSLRKS